MSKRGGFACAGTVVALCSAAWSADPAAYTRRGTWQETMQASREALVAWECKIDTLILHRSGVTLGPWQLR